MKTLIITNERGEIEGIVRYQDEQDDGGPEKIELEPMEGQRVHEIQLPSELEGIDSVLDLYEAVERGYTLDMKSGTLTHDQGASA